MNEVLEGHATPPAALSVTACQSCSPLQKRIKKKAITDVTSVRGKEMQLVNWHTHQGFFTQKTKQKKTL